MQQMSAFIYFDLPIGYGVLQKLLYDEEEDDLPSPDPDEELDEDDLPSPDPDEE